LDSAEQLNTTRIFCFLNL